MPRCSLSGLPWRAVVSALMEAIPTTKPAVQTTCEELPVEPLPPNITSAQPGGGVCYRVELAWGRLRRWYLRTFRPGYVARMKSLRQGSDEGAPHEILDPRDLKYCGNLCDAHWPVHADRFAWREKLPLARWGLAELILIGGPFAGITLALWTAGGVWRWACGLTAAVLATLVYFFRDPPRRAPSGSGIVVSPADGTVVEVAQLERDPFLEGPAVRVSIFLSLFNVHINRAPDDCRVIWLRYEPGKFLNAMRPESAWLNESMTIGVQQREAPYGRMVVRQVSGLVARRIVCCLRPGQTLQRGEKFGMIKLGSRTEIVLPADAWELKVAPGDRLRAGTSIVARARVAAS